MHCGERPRSSSLRNDCVFSAFSLFAVSLFGQLRKQRHIFFTSQLKHLLSTNLLSEAELHIVASTPFSHGEIIDEAQDRLMQQFPQHVDSLLADKGVKFKLSLTLGNFFEYPGIVHLWRSIENETEAFNTLFLYFHTKGMVFHGSEYKRQDEHIFRTVIEPWKEVSKRFQEDVRLNKAAYAISERGFAWYNFFWARGSYLQRLEHPMTPAAEQQVRYYYEDWLSRQQLKGQARTGIDLHLDLVTDPPLQRRKNGSYHSSSCADGWSMVLGRYGYVRNLGMDGGQIAKVERWNKSIPLPTRTSGYANEFGEACRMVTL
eukprot:gene30321-36640_t